VEEARVKKKQHRLGVSETNLVVRHLKLVTTNVDRINDAIAEIDEIYGLDAVSFNDKSNVIDVAYDASRICIDCIEEVLQKYDIEVSHDWWNRFKEDYYRFVDQNVKDNADHIPFSCHKIPPHK